MPAAKAFIHNENDDELLIASHNMSTKLIVDQLFLAGGQIGPMVTNLSLWNTANRWTETWNMLLHALHPTDVLILIWIAYSTVPFFGFVYINYYFTYSGSTNNDYRPYRESYTYQMAILIRQAACLALVVYLMDACILLTSGLWGTSTIFHSNLSYIFAKIIYTVWLAYRVSKFKRYCVQQVFWAKQAKKTVSKQQSQEQSQEEQEGREQPKEETEQKQPEPPSQQKEKEPHSQSQSQPLGRASILDRLLDGVICLCTTMFVLDILNVELGIGMASMLAFGSGIGTLIVTLAFQDLASLIVNGLVLSTSNRVVEGDNAEFGSSNGSGGKDGNNIVGTIVKIGWMHTIVRNYDNLEEVVPNDQLGNQRVKNITQAQQSRTQQTLRFSYHDVEKLPQLLNDIVEEIKVACSPLIITDGSKPLRAVWSDFREDYAKVVVTVHYNCRPFCPDYWEMHQKCLMAIHRAVQKNDVKFVTTFCPQDA